MASEGAIGTFGSIFELHDSQQESFTGPMVRTLSAVLSDQLGKECLKMVVTPTTASALKLRDQTNLPRFFVLADNPSRPELLKPLPKSGGKLPPRPLQ